MHVCIIHVVSKKIGKCLQETNNLEVTVSVTSKDQNENSEKLDRIQ